MKRHRKIQLFLVSIGALLFALTYLFYPNINKDRIAKNKPSDEIYKKNLQEETTSFENLEYKGLYDFDKTFKVKSEKAYILNEEPDIVYMQNMHVILNLSDGRIVNIVSDKGIYNKKTYDCFFQQNVKATDESTEIFAENLDLLATENSVKIYNNVILNNQTSNLLADKIDYDFETKLFKISMFDENNIKMRIIQ